MDVPSIHTVPDPQDLLHREPLVASFTVRGAPPPQAFTFKLINIHTNPDEADMEVDALADVFTAEQSRDPEDDVILLGDLNADENSLGEIGRLPVWGVFSAMEDTPRVADAGDQTLPSPNIGMNDDVQYYPPDGEFEAERREINAYRIKIDGD